MICINMVVYAFLFFGDIQYPKTQKIVPFIVLE